jgi:hypothetical protein
VSQKTPQWEVKAAPTGLPAQPGENAPRQVGILLFTSTPKSGLLSTPPAPEENATESSPTAPEQRVARVLWDTSHGPRQGQDGAYTVAGIFHNLGQLLAEQEIYLLDDDQALPKCALSAYSAIILSATSVYSTAISQEEAGCIWQFVQDGGGLIILTERPCFPNQLREVMDAFGVQAFLDPEQNSVADCPNHPICAGIENIEFYQGGTLSGDNSWVVAASAGSPAVLVREDLPGRVVIIGDSNLFDDRWLKPNRAFARNIFLWVTE